MKHLFFSILLITIALNSTDAQTALKEISKVPLTFGEVVSIDSKILSESRTLNIYLPDGYNTADTLKYPVIYLLDGSMNKDFLHIVGLVQFFNLQMNMPKTIVVGIANIDRKRDFTFPTTDRKLKMDYPTTGGSRKFIDFLESEVQPYIKANYPTTNQKMLIGQSLGGLLATEILFKKPTLFTDYIIVSPSLWWDNESLLKDARMFLGAHSKMPANVYVSVGAEGEIMEREAKSLAELLKNSGKPNLNSEFLFLSNENHATILHQSVNDTFKLMYPYKEN
ncbi:alpha/beta hydrolase-fold protein [Gelidibacter japonicus]|uniref:alpha/beta hydrolase n=1 Tax=Gelidibacter japonicus TaxID=1962232 RepID=UPI002021151D|nr:alpha/beta hydrolase-fold protein [Gelidibacter japonicus]MCL8006858.1 alpha/beta hydrolase-fold protein [Gelidibacter japonicus]